MLSKVLSLGLSGVNGYEVQTECYIGTGLPAFDLVGLPDASVKEARERVRAAIKNCGFRFPVSRIIVNLAPAGTKKSGTLYDLPILLSILAASEQVKLPKKRCAFLGELSLEGALRAVPGVLPMALAAKRLGYEELYVPEDNARGHAGWRSGRLRRKGHPAADRAPDRPDADRSRAHLAAGAQNTAAFGLQGCKRAGKCKARP